MGGGDLNMKKSWHPLLRSNQERVWKQEKKAYEERKKLDELRRERDQEREMQELQRLQEEAGGKKKMEKVDWMYATPASGSGPSASELEDYLLGKKRVDQFINEKAKQANNDALAQNKSSGSQKDSFKAVQQNLNSAQDLAAKIREDPMFAIKQQEQQAYQALLKDPTRLRQMRIAAGLDVPDEADRDSRRHGSSKRRKYDEDDARDRDGHRRHRSSHRDGRDRESHHHSDSRRDSHDKHSSSHSSRRRGSDSDDERERSTRRNYRDDDDDRRRRDGGDARRRENRDDTDSRRSRSPADSRRRAVRDEEYAPGYRRDRRHDTQDRDREYPRDTKTSRSERPRSRSRSPKLAPARNGHHSDRCDQADRPTSWSSRGPRRDRRDPFSPPPQARTPHAQRANVDTADKEDDRAARLARMQSNAREVTAERSALLAKVKEEEAVEHAEEEKARRRMERRSEGGKASFLLDQQRTTGMGSGRDSTIDLEERLKRSRGGLQRVGGDE